MPISSQTILSGQCRCKSFRLPNRLWQGIGSGGMQIVSWCFIVILFMQYYSKQSAKLQSKEKIILLIIKDLRKQNEKAAQIR